LSLADAISADAQRMAEIESFADLHIDTSGLKPADMRRLLLSGLGAPLRAQIPVSVISFSYRNGMPEEADIALDMRFADNPHWIEELREKTGRDKEVDAYLAQDDAAQAVMRHAKDMLSIMLDRMAGEGRPAVTIAFGCTGGQHRSVWAAETIASWLRKRGHEINLHHRELDGSA